MFTKHTVEFKFSTDEDSLRKHFNEMLKIINWQLNQLGTAYDLLSEDRKFVVNSSLGGISGDIPMLCFTEVAEGKRYFISWQYFWELWPCSIKKVVGM